MHYDINMYLRLVYPFKYIYIWLYMAIYTYIYAVFRCMRGVPDLFTVHSHPESWCTLHQADTAMM